jgi:hypothetical protein
MICLAMLCPDKFPCPLYVSSHVATLISCWYAVTLVCVSCQALSFTDCYWLIFSLQVTNICRAHYVCFVCMFICHCCSGRCAVCLCECAVGYTLYLMLSCLSALVLVPCLTPPPINLRCLPDCALFDLANVSLFALSELFVCSDIYLVTPMYLAVWLLVGDCYEFVDRWIDRSWRTFGCRCYCLFCVTIGVSMRMNMSFHVLRSCSCNWSPVICPAICAILLYLVCDAVWLTAYCQPPTLYLCLCCVRPVKC